MHFLRLPIITKQAEPIALGIKPAVLFTEKVMHLQRDGHQGYGLQKDQRGIAVVQVRTLGKLNEEKVRI